MVGKIDFEIKGATEMEKLLKELGPRVAGSVTDKALKAGARPIIKEAKLRVRKRTGGLAKSIAVRTDKKLKASAGHELGVNIGFLPPHSRRAHFEEFGTSKHVAHPFMRPAMDAKVGEALDAMGKVMGKGIEREAVKMAKD